MSSDACPVLSALVETWGHALLDADREVLLGPYDERIAAAPPGPADARALMALDWLVRECAPAWLHHAGGRDQARKLTRLTSVDGDPARTRAAIDAALRSASRLSDGADDRSRDAGFAAANASGARAAAVAAAKGDSPLATVAAAVATACAEAAAAAARWDRDLSPVLLRTQGSALDLLDAMIELE